MDTGATTVPELHGFYGELHGLVSGTSDELVATLEARLQEHRVLTRRARHLLRVAEEAEDAIFVALTGVRDGTAATALRGAYLASIAVQTLNESGLAQPIHYRDWYQLLRDQGLRVAGKDPLATFLTAISRHPGVAGEGRMSGLYRVRAGA